MSIVILIFKIEFIKLINYLKVGQDMRLCVCIFVCKRRERIYLDLLMIVMMMAWLQGRMFLFFKDVGVKYYDGYKLFLIGLEKNIYR